MEARRLRFAAALIVFLAWVASLGAMAALSGHGPEVRHGMAAPPDATRR
jgi:hypothetical protein